MEEKKYKIPLFQLLMSEKLILFKNKDERNE